MATRSPSQALVFSGPLVEAQRVWSALRGHGLEAWLFDQYAGLGYGAGMAEVVVRAEELERASALLVELGLVIPGDPAR